MQNLAPAGSSDPQFEQCGVALASEFPQLKQKRALAGFS